MAFEAALGIKELKEDLACDKTQGISPDMCFRTRYQLDILGLEKRTREGRYLEIGGLLYTCTLGTNQPA